MAIYFLKVTYHLRKNPDQMVRELGIFLVCNTVVRVQLRDENGNNT